MSLFRGWFVGSAKARRPLRCSAPSAAVWLGLVLVAADATAAATSESVCYGTPSAGRLEHGQQLPASGPNFQPYSRLGVAAGRTYVHSKVAATIASAYQSLAVTAPDTHYVYGESGWKDGGRIRPHRTHQNGLAVDFMVPVLDAKAASVPLPANVGNKWGYGIEFDADARHGDLRIDFDAIAAHLAALHLAAEAQGIRVSRVIFENSYLPKLFAASQGAWVRQHVTFMQGEPWIRHDEHYHVDFAVGCRPLPD